jgi:hypothetical protein
VKKPKVQAEMKILSIFFLILTAVALIPAAFGENDLCQQYEDLVDASLRNYMKTHLEGFHDNSAVRETNRLLNKGIILLEVQNYLYIMNSNNCLQGFSSDNIHPLKYFNASKPCIDAIKLDPLAIHGSECNSFFWPKPESEKK